MQMNVQNYLYMHTRFMYTYMENPKNLPITSNSSGRTIYCNETNIVCVLCVVIEATHAYLHMVLL